MLKTMIILEEEWPRQDERAERHRCKSPGGGERAYFCYFRIMNFKLEAELAGDPSRDLPV